LAQAFRWWKLKMTEVPDVKRRSRYTTIFEVESDEIASELHLKINKILCDTEHVVYPVSTTIAPGPVWYEVKKQGGAKDD